MSEIDLIRQIADLQKRLAIQETRETPLIWRSPFDFRMSLVSGSPVMTTDQLAKTVLYCTPNGNGNALGLEGTIYYPSEFSISNAGLAASAVYDVFVYSNLGSPALELLAWTNATTRATALANHPTYGYLSKSGATSRRYACTLATDTNGKFQKRFAGGVAAGAAAEVGLWNFYNRRKERYTIYDDTNSWAYNIAAWRGWDNSTLNRINTLMGLSEDSVVMRFNDAIVTSAGYSLIGIGLDATNAIASDCLPGILQNVLYASIVSLFDGHPGIGSHYLQLLEWGNAGGGDFFWG